jgi:hypothetical protein
VAIGYTCTAQNDVMVGTEIFDFKLHRLKEKNEVIMTDELGKIKDINSQAKKRLQQIQLVEKHGTEKQAFLRLAMIY